MDQTYNVRDRVWKRVRRCIRDCVWDCVGSNVTGRVSVRVWCNVELIVVFDIKIGVLKELKSQYEPNE